MKTFLTNLVKAYNKVKEEEEKSRRDAESEENLNLQKRIAQLTSTHKDFFYERYKEEIEFFKQKITLPVEKGMRVIVNKYNLKNSSANFWDGGTNILLSPNSPVTYATILDAFPDKSYMFEMVDRFFESAVTSKQILDLHSSTLWFNYKNLWIQERHFTLPSHMFIYWTVTFHIEGKEKPNNYGINAYCFLEAESTEGLKTSEIWNKECELFKERERLYKEKETLNLKLEVLQKNYQELICPLYKKEEI
jgi:hypothetical protein